MNEYLHSPSLHNNRSDDRRVVVIFFVVFLFLRIQFILYSYTNLGIEWFVNMFSFHFSFKVKNLNFRFWSKISSASIYTATLKKFNFLCWMSKFISSTKSYWANFIHMIFDWASQLIRFHKRGSRKSTLRSIWSLWIYSHLHATCSCILFNFSYIM